MREERDVPPYEYFLRALRLVAPEWPLFVVGFACLICTSAAQLLLPSYQGKVIDHVVHGDQANFTNTGRNTDGT